MNSETKIFDISLYNDEFFEWHKKHTIEYQTKTFQWYIDEYKPHSVVDFGCGIGTYLDVARRNNIPHLKGYDIGGEFARKYTPLEVQSYIEYLDCTKIIDQKGCYKCVLSFETAEHIEPSGTGTFIQNILNASALNGTILFTAAPPGQDGCGHINLHPKDFWINKFGSGKGIVNYEPEKTKKIADKWKEIGCPDYISENLLVFTNIF